MLYLVYAIHIIICLFLIMVVLLQQGKGADLSVFGGGSTQAAFGARGAATLLHKMTVAGFIAFIFTTMSIGFLQSGSRGSVMEAVEAAPETPIEVEVPIAEPPSSGALEDSTSPAESGGMTPAPAADEAPAAPEPPGQGAAAEGELPDGP